MKDFLIEVGVEPFPARFIPGTLTQLKTKVEALLQANRLTCKAVRTLGTYRRLTVIIDELAEKSLPLNVEALGPKVQAAKDAQGAWTQAALGFAKSQGVKPETLTIVQSPKGEVVCAKKTLPGEAADKILLRELPGVLTSLEFPKNMVWNETKTRFGRPIRTLTALWGTKPLTFTFAGVKSGKAVTGLAALGSKAVKVPNPAKYTAALKSATVLADPVERRASLEKGLDLAVKRIEGVHADKDAALIDETVYLTEHPVAVHGEFDPKYVKLPAALLSLVMKKQLKFFPVIDKKGKLTHHFIGVRDGISEGQKEVQEGFERVIAARLYDALFFFEKDLKSTLEAKRERLKDLSFLAKVGNMLEKAERVEALAGKLSQGAAPIARLAYADLVSELVREFPELQGLMGGVYAAHENLPYADGVSDFYLPVSPESPLPRGADAQLASLAGKLDTLAANFAVGNIPSGSEDPFGLRRQAAGAVRIVLDGGLNLDLAALAREQVLEIRNRFPEAGVDPQAAGDALERFLWQRVEAVCTDKGLPADEVKAVSRGGLANLPRTLKRLDALHKGRSIPEFASLAAAFKRADNILRQAKIDRSANHLDPAKFQQQEETDLWLELGKVADAVTEKLRKDEFEASLQEMARLKEPLDRFFDKVMVMADDPAVKANRLSLLARLVSLLSSVADLSKLQA